MNRQKLLTQQNVDSIFNIFDINGDGQIDIAELKKVFQGKLDLGDNMEESNTSSRSMSTYAGQNEEEVWKIILNQADTDKDGKISKNEFRTTMSRVID